MSQEHLVSEEELYLAQYYPEEYIHGLNISSAALHAYQSAESRTVAEISRHGSLYVRSLENQDAKLAHIMGYLAGSREPLSNVTLDLGDTHE
jgi:hypothetical protein